jgi:hypothetical protein
MATLFKEHHGLLQHVLKEEAAEINGEVVPVGFQKS